MSQIYHIGSAVSAPGTIQYGRWDAYRHPTGNVEFLPVIIAQGFEDGPCLWLTAGIHGPEHAGAAALYRLLTAELAAQMRGTIIAIPALNPVGLRSMQREPYHVDKDPNRMWPDGRPAQPPNPDRDPPSALEEAYHRLFDLMLESADYMIDFHAAWTGSMPFAFRDRVLYREDGNAEKSRQEALDLSEVQYEVLKAFGHSIILEMPAEKLFDEDLHRSTSGALLYLGRIPAFTVELGTGYVPEPAIVAAAAAGTRNVMRYAGMLDGPLEAVGGIPVVDPGFVARRCTTPRVKDSCVVLHLVEAGDLVKAGQPVAEVRDVWGAPLGDGYLRSEYDGYVIGRHHGIYYYAGQSVMSMAIPNDAPLVLPYPAGYFGEQGHQATG